MPSNIRDSRGATYGDHSVPTMRGSSDKSHVVIGPLTPEGLEQTDYWKSLGSNADRVTLLQKLGFPNAAETENGGIDIGAFTTQNRVFILAKRDGDNITPVRLYSGQMTQEPAAGSIFEGVKLLFTGNINTPYVNMADRTSSATITSTLRIPENGGVTNLPAERLRNPINLKEGSGINYNRAGRGETTIDNSAVDQMLEAHESGDLVLQQQPNMAEMLARGPSAPSETPSTGEVVSPGLPQQAGRSNGTQI